MDTIPAAGPGMVANRIEMMNTLESAVKIVVKTAEKNLAAGISNCRLYCSDVINSDKKLRQMLNTALSPKHQSVEPY